MANEPKTIMINDVEYAPVKNQKSAEVRDGMNYVLVRGDRSGVFTGYLESKKDKEVILRDARRIWYWSGAASISQLAVDGVAKPTECKFPCELDTIQILDAIEIINCTEKARKSIAAVKIWEE